jgi:iron-sulfur cluster assembly protein
MITLTDTAAEQLRNLLDREELADHSLRIFVQGGGCAGLQYGMLYEDAAQENDLIVEEKGVRILVDPFSATYLQGACIDHRDTPMGPGFRVDNPNAVANCACGSSFRTEGDTEVERTCD